MFSTTSWGQFLAYIAVAIVLYGLAVLFIFYRKTASKALTTSPVVGKPAEAEPLNGTPTSVMGKTREQKNGHRLSPTPGITSPVSCEACGHVHGSPVAAQVNSYGLPISNPPVAPMQDTPLVDDFEPVDGGIELSSLLEALEKVKEIPAMTVAGDTSDSVAEDKAAALSLFATHDLLNSEFSSFVAVELDNLVPTEGYSAVASLEVLKAA